MTATDGIYCPKRDARSFYTTGREALLCCPGTQKRRDNEGRQDAPVPTGAYTLTHERNHSLTAGTSLWGQSTY